ncbi:hypothetical protein JAAARDRAFT_193189 [Jaapia argillacea MUCL 33604]|uniref:Uncharacterized protein n=1 Tax=Jaapia argillacea MUCL 33604 TaxID=933084 RepID=A0A067Q7S1_9AGAM|nr:hypothetical protein JAAARDRAFT_193189 [Jaapia argillacea MUCL 33604]
MPAATGTNPIVDSVDRRLPSFDEDPDRDLVASMLSYTTPDCILINFACGPISLLEKVVCVAKADLREACCPFSGYTALHFAAEMGVEENVRWMLDHGSAWNGRDRLGNRAIDLARKEGHQECSKFLFEYAVEKEYARYYLPYTTPPDEWDNPVDKDRTPQVEGYFKSVVMYTSPQQTAHDFAMVDMGTGTGVMMEWERPLMKETARLLLEGLPKGVRILNVGFGLGIIDTYFQENCPSNHTIIEAHPNCIDFMRKTRWFGERNRHTERSPQLVSKVSREEIGRFDVVYFDTFAEGYRAYMEFYQYLPSLLSGPNARVSFFHGLGAHSLTVYEIYSEVISRHLYDVGLNVDWSECHIPPEVQWISYSEGVDGQNHPYKIPICRLAPTVRRTVVPDCGWRGDFEASPLSTKSVT